MRAMTRSSVINWCSVLGMLAGLGASFWRPDASWPAGLLFGSIVLGFFDTESQRTVATRRSVRYWLAPALVLAMAAQFVYFARPEERLRMWAFAAVLTIAAGALLVVRRPRS